MGSVKKSADAVGWSYGHARKVAAESGVKAILAKIQGALEEKAFNKFEVTEAKLISRLAQLAFLDPAEMFDEKGKLLPIPDMPEHVRSFVGAKVGDIKSATETLCKIKGMLTEKVQISPMSKILKDVAAMGGADEPLVKEPEAAETQH